MGGLISPNLRHKLIIGPSQADYRPITGAVRYVLDFWYVVPFRNQGASNATGLYTYVKPCSNKI